MTKNLGRPTDHLLSRWISIAWTIYRSPRATGRPVFLHTGKYTPRPAVTYYGKPFGFFFSISPPNLTMSTILFRSCWVPFRSPTFSACRHSFCPPNWPNLSFYSDLVGSRFELRAAHPYWFWPGVPPPPWDRELFPNIGNSNWRYREICHQGSKSLRKPKWLSIVTGSIHSN